MTADDGEALRPIARVATGVPGLDEVLDGGLLRGGVYLLYGPPGAGKTVLGNQVAFAHAPRDGRVVYLTMLAETHDRMLAHLRSLAFFAPSSVRDGITYVSGYRALEQEGLAGLLELVRRAIRDRRATLLVFDELKTARMAAASELEFKRFLHELHAYASALGCTALLLTTQDGQSADSAEHVVADGVIELGEQRSGLRTVRELEVRKLRGGGYMRGRHTFEIAREGVVVYPRAEARRASAPAQGAAQPSGRPPRASIGIARLDAMLHGGLLHGTTTLVLGPAGSGKTVLGLQFLAAGARAGEPGLYVGFYERPEGLAQVAAHVGIELDELVARGLIEVRAESLRESLLDALAVRVLDAVRRRGVRRLFIDGLAGFEHAAVHRERLGRFLAVLADDLSALGVTTLWTEESHEPHGPYIHLPIAAVSAVAANIVLLRCIERPERLHRLITIRKERASGFDSATYEFEITDRGIEVAATPESAAAVLRDTHVTAGHEPAPDQPGEGLRADRGGRT